MDVVIQFAVHKLGFSLSDIVIYAWSIGGFTGSQRQEQHMLFFFPVCCAKKKRSNSNLEYPEVKM